jgi:hypothetical protein
MDARTLARLHSVGRVAIGAAAVAAPGMWARAWIGDDGRRRSVGALAVGLGARDAAIGLGVVRAVGEGHGARPWLAAGVVGDAADLVATLRRRDELPAAAVVGVSLLAGGSIAAGAWLARELD